MNPERVKDYTKKQTLSTALSVGFFLAYRQVKRSNIWTNFLIVFIMTLTFLNMVVVSGVLVGLLEGAVQAVGTRYLGDIFISAKQGRPYIEKTSTIISTAQNLPGVKYVNPRYLESGTIEENYQEIRKPGELSRAVGTSFVGINPIKEDLASGLSSLLIRGEYLEPDDYDQVLIGALLLKEFLDFESPIFLTLEDVHVGDKVRISVGGSTRDVRIKGIVRSKVDELDRRVFFTDTQFRSLINRYDYNANEIMVVLEKGVDPIAIKNALIASGADRYARVQTRDDAEPKFIKDMKKTFATLGNIISSIGVVVASITIFIVIFINAITRRKFIGILKGIGISSTSIEVAYIIQSLLYAIAGSGIGLLIVFGVLEPYFLAHPINFPFSDGILAVSVEGALIRVAILVVATIAAGYIPARIVTKQNTLDAILGR